VCYSIYVSTDCPEDLGAQKFKHLNFNNNLAPEPSHVQLLPLLAYPHRWFLNRAEYGGCSCQFRHSLDPQFEPPQDWMPEDEDNVSATKEAYQVFRRIVDGGYRLDLIDVFSGETFRDEIQTLAVSLESVAAESFRFFEGYRFVFEA
jgi:hypothetical protein